jgi:hypothetical protein
MATQPLLKTLNPNGRTPSTAIPGMTTNDAAGPGMTTVPGGGHRLTPGGEIPKPGAPGGTAPVTPTTSPTSPAAPFTPSNPATIAAQDDPRLTGLADRYNAYLDKFEGGTGSAMDLAAGRFRDAREGGRAAMSNDAAFRGVTADTGKYDRSTLRGEQGAIANVAAQREATQGENLRGGLGIAGAPGEANRADRNLNMDWWSRQQNAGQQAWENQRSQANDAFNQFLALLGQARQGPLPPGVTMPTAPGASAAPPPPGVGGSGRHF